MVDKNRTPNPIKTKIFDKISDSIYQGGKNIYEYLN